MMNQKILLLIQIISFVTYLTFIIKKFGVLPSISESYYRLSRNGQILFTLFMWFISFPMAMYGGLMFFLSGTSLTFVGAATMFKDDKITKKIHYMGAIFGLTFGLIALFLNNLYYPLIGSAIVTAICVWGKIPNKIFWIEVLIALFIIAGLTHMIL